MERRSVPRYPLDVSALVMPGEEERPGTEGSEARVRDMSSRGISFFSDAEWSEGNAIIVLVKFNKEGLRPYSYNLRVAGNIVRCGRDETGKPYFAAHFKKNGEVVEWQERRGDSSSQGAGS
jgi:hypothetical protein